MKTTLNQKLVRQLAAIGLHPLPKALSASIEEELEKEVTEFVEKKITVRRVCQIAHKAFLPPVKPRVRAAAQNPLP